MRMQRNRKQTYRLVPSNARQNPSTRTIPAAPSNRQRYSRRYTANVVTPSKHNYAPNALNRLRKEPRHQLFPALSCPVHRPSSIQPLQNETHVLCAECATARDSPLGRSNRRWSIHTPTPSYGVHSVQQPQIPSWTGGQGWSIPNRSACKVCNSKCSANAISPSKGDSRAQRGRGVLPHTSNSLKITRSLCKVCNLRSVHLLATTRN